MLRIVLSVGMLAFAAGTFITGTTAFFGDTERSTGNTFSAGAVDLKIDNESYYNGAFNEGTSWELKDLNGDLFFNFLDLKPDDEGEDTISLHVDDNDAWACMDIEITATDDNECNEPEAADGDLTCGLNEGELQNEINFVWWSDDGDNVLEDDEVEQVFSQSSLGNLSQSIVLADANGQGILNEEGPLAGGGTYYIGKAWCFGDLTIDAVDQDGEGKLENSTNGPLVRGTGISCDGSGLDNTTQTDSVMGDITFTAVQARHNEGFVCNEGGGLGCTEQADVMLVLDRSGSINNTEFAVLQDAAKSFVDALAPSTGGVHVGLASFATNGTLDVHLTEDGDSVKTAIDGLSSGGLTNLFEGLEWANDELENVFDADDRDDSVSPDFIVVITDGEPNEPGSDINAANVATAEAGLARLNGIEIFAVGVGITTDAANYLRNNIVSPAADNHYFDAADFDEIEAVLSGIAVCEDELSVLAP